MAATTMLALENTDAPFLNVHMRVTEGFLDVISFCAMFVPDILA